MIQNIQVSNLISPRSGREVANQFEIRTSDGVYFQSYNTMIAFMPHGGGKLVLDKDSWDYSTTTAKYRNQFTGLTTKETQAKIKSGDIELADLN